MLCSFTIVSIVNGIVRLACVCKVGEDRFFAAPMVWKPGDHEYPVFVRGFYSQIQRVVGDEVIDAIRKVAPQALKELKGRVEPEKAEDLVMKSITVEIKTEGQKGKLPF